jgi:hypothetical protein
MPAESWNSSWRGSGLLPSRTHCLVWSGVHCGNWQGGVLVKNEKRRCLAAFLARPAWPPCAVFELAAVMLLDHPRPPWRPLGQPVGWWHSD